MGSCVSLCKGSECSAVKMSSASAVSVIDKFEIPPSPIKDYKLLNNNTDSVNKDISVILQKSPSGFVTVSSIGHGSKEEAFFDSRAWLDSDCEDFFSVKGDFTPSCGNTPLHHVFPIETPRASKACNGDKVSGFSPPPLPIKRRKKLAELFRESIGEDASFVFLHNEKNNDLTNGEVESKPTAFEKTRHGNDYKLKFCCLAQPFIVSCRRSSKRKKNLNPTAVAVNDISFDHISDQKKLQA